MCSEHRRTYVCTCTCTTSFNITSNDNVIFNELRRSYVGDDADAQKKSGHQHELCYFHFIDVS